jgi:thiol:disulfide interchange protein DsbA
MHRVFRGLAGALLALSLVTAQSATPGKDYEELISPQPTSTAGKIEVIEFFSFACPHCNAFEPALEAWVAKLPADVVFKRVPVSFNRPEWQSLARLNYALENMGVIDRTRAKVFHAIHEEHLPLFTTDASADWAATQGLDRAKFLSYFNGFSMQSQLQRSDTQVHDFRISGVPSIAVNGRYVTSPAAAGGFTAALAVVDELIERSRPARK